jgi:hypothetical protein
MKCRLSLSRIPGPAPRLDERIFLTFLTVQVSSMPRAFLKSTNEEVLSSEKSI